MRKCTVTIECMKKSVTRLCIALKPLHYSLNLRLEPETKKFSGTVTIRLRKTGPPSQRITLHQKALNIQSAILTRHDKKGDEQITIDRINTHNAFDELRLHTDKKIFAGQYTVKITFDGRITDPMNGLYPCYFTHDGQQKQLLATQFESHHAREVFPCIDEPDAKATFDLVLTTPKDGVVLANTPIQQQTVNQNTMTTSFETTPVMSTYLLAFVYGELGYTESKTGRGTIVRAYATPDNVTHTQFAVETAVRCLEFYESYFDIAYPLAKCDMVALPDFASGAMENWGLITYREQTLLVDQRNTSLGTKQYVAMVVAHELAHQWFGNLVTMRWWTDLWLNEGFASWIEYLAIDTLFPDWQMWTQFIASEQQPALKLDALDSTHPIEVAIHHPDEIRSIFDAISYNKGASVIHMLHGYLGADLFRDGLRHYLKKHAYDNADTKDLWTALEDTSGKPVREFMHSWTSLPGFPLLSVKKQKDMFHLEQHRFYALEPNTPRIEVWPIPLLAGPEANDQMQATNAQISTHITKFNQGQSGFYRTHYDEASLHAIKKSVPTMSPVDRLGILADVFETAKAGYGSTSDAIALLKKYEDEDNAAVWDIIAAQLGDLRRVMDDEAIRESIKPLIRQLISKQYSRLGWLSKQTDNYFDNLLRPTILALAASADETSVVEEAIKRFTLATSSESIEPDLRGIVYTTAARHGNLDTFEKLKKFHNQSESSEERTTISAALTAFEQPDITDRALEMIRTNDVRRQDAMYWVAYSFMNRHAKHATWQWMQSNWQWLDKELGSDLSFFRTPIYAARSFSNSEFLKEYDAFFEPKRSPSLTRSIDQGREMLQIQIGWKKRDAGSVRSALKA